MSHWSPLYRWIRRTVGRIRSGYWGVSDRRPVIVDLLEMLASEERQRDYEARVPYVDITAELQCMWFDDFYVPDDLFFRSCFSKREFNAVREFNAFYRRKSRELPPSQGTIETWLASPVWRDIMAEAKSTLNKLELG